MLVSGRSALKSLVSQSEVIIIIIMTDFLPYNHEAFAPGSFWYASDGSATTVKIKNVRHWGGSPEDVSQWAWDVVYDCVGTEYVNDGWNFQVRYSPKPLNKGVDE